jgi:hypothetical protein
LKGTETLRLFYRPRPRRARRDSERIGAEPQPWSAGKSTSV